MSSAETLEKDPVASAGLPDGDALRVKYRAERDKRMRSDGDNQYRELTGDLGHYLDDPYVEPGFTREALTDEVEVAVIGGGFGGLLSAAKLREAGVKSIRVIEKGGDFGGTWYWNRYPGVACDIESYIYIPLLEELGYMPKEKYASGAEIFAHCQTIGQHYDLYRDACFQTEVTDVRWDEDAARWIVTTDRGDVIRAQFVVMTNGLFNRPKLPGIPGIETFKGHSFHTSRWDYAYTGGDRNGGLVNLKDKKVGIIGTGATALQCVPALAEWAGHLYVFQRTPSSVDVRGNGPTDPDWAQKLAPGWQRKRMENWNVLVSGGYQEEDLVNDGWTDIFHDFLKKASEPGADIAALFQQADDKKMEQLRARIDAVVKDKATAEALKPWYNRFCKRPGFHDQYLEVFNQPNVTLVDTQGKGVEKVTENALVVGGKPYELDCLIYATGFDVDLFRVGSSGYDVTGVNGRTLADKWKDGASTLHGMHSRGFPNLFVLSVVQSGVTLNVPHLLTEQSEHLAYVISECMKRGIRTEQPTQEAEDDYLTKIELSAFLTREFQETCTPGYYNKEGKPGDLQTRNGFFSGGSVAFFQLLSDWRAEGRLDGLELTFQE